mgnify:CR=1 FL=1
MVAAISAAREGAKVTIIEHQNKLGKKILSTGNGKCNYTNELQGVTFYRGDDPAFVLPVMEQFGFDETVSFFEKLGIYPKSRNGYYYPASEAGGVLSWKCLAWNAITSALICGRPADCNPFKKPVPGMKYAPQKARFQPKQ